MVIIKSIILPNEASLRSEELATSRKEMKERQVGLSLKQFVNQTSLLFEKVNLNAIYLSDADEIARASCTQNDELYL
jgi:hypothetical protein